MSGKRAVFKAGNWRIIQAIVETIRTKFVPACMEDFKGGLHPADIYSQMLELTSWREDTEVDLSSFQLGAHMAALGLAWEREQEERTRFAMRMVA